MFGIGLVSYNFLIHDGILSANLSQKELTLTFSLIRLWEQRVIISVASMHIHDTPTVFIKT